MSDASPAPPRLPRAFGNYMLFDHIGRGGMAEIYLARLATESGASRHVVVKQILPELAERHEFAEMLVREAKLASRLTHKNVVQVTDLGRAGDQLFIAMEYVEGFDLATLLRRCSKDRVPLPPEFALYFVLETLAGLDYAHRAKDDTGAPLGIVHRDVSPSNVLVSFEGEVKVCDFGIARANDPSSAEDADEAIKGKAGYMSPEHATGSVVLDARADVFAAGIVLWELVAGRKLYSSKAGSLLEQARTAAIGPLPPREMPEFAELEAIVSRALAPSRDDRYASAGAMRRDLEDYVRSARLHASALRLGAWLTEHFAADIVERRRMRERGARALMLGPAVVMTPVVDRTPRPSSVVEAGVASEAAADAATAANEEDSAPESIVSTTIDVPSAAGSLPAVERDSAAPAPSGGRTWLVVLLAIVVLAAAWFATHRG